MTRYSIFLSLVILTTGILPVYAQDTLRISLGESVARAIEMSPELKVEKSKIYAAESLHSFAKANRYLTQFNLQSAHSLAPGLSESEFPVNDLYLDPALRYQWSNLSPFNQVQLDIVQPLYTFGQIRGSINAAREGIGVAEANGQDKTLTVARRVAVNYVDLLLAMELKRLADETGKVLEQAEGEVEKLLEEGAEDVDDADLFQVKIVKQDYLARVVEVNESLRLARSALGKQLFLEEGQLVAPDKESLEAFQIEMKSLDDYQLRAQSQRPEIKKAKSAYAARSHLLKVAKSDYYPKIVLGASGRIGYAPGHYKQKNPFISDPFIGSGFEAGVGLRFNLNFSQTKAKVAQARAQQQEVLALREGAEILIDLEVEEAYRKALIKKAAMDSQSEAVRISGEWLRTEQINFDLEIGNTENLIKALQSNLEMRASYLSKTRDYNVSVLNLLDALGTLPEDVGRL